MLTVNNVRFGLALTLLCVFWSLFARADTPAGFVEYFTAPLPAGGSVMIPAPSELGYMGATSAQVHLDVTGENRGYTVMFGTLMYADLTAHVVDPAVLNLGRLPIQAVHKRADSTGTIVIHAYCNGNPPSHICGWPNGVPNVPAIRAGTQQMPDGVLECGMAEGSLIFNMAEPPGQAQILQPGLTHYAGLPGMILHRAVFLLNLEPGIPQNWADAVRIKVYNANVHVGGDNYVPTTSPGDYLGQAVHCSPFTDASKPWGDYVEGETNPGISYPMALYYAGTTADEEETVCYVWWVTVPVIPPPTPCPTCGHARHLPGPCATDGCQCPNIPPPDPCPVCGHAVHLPGPCATEGCLCPNIPPPDPCPVCGHAKHLPEPCPVAGCVCPKCPKCPHSPHDVENGTPCPAPGCVCPPPGGGGTGDCSHNTTLTVNGGTTTVQVPTAMHTDVKNMPDTINIIPEAGTIKALPATKGPTIKGAEGSNVPDAGAELGKMQDAIGSGTVGDIEAKSADLVEQSKSASYYGVLAAFGDALSPDALASASSDTWLTDDVIDPFVSDLPYVDKLDLSPVRSMESELLASPILSKLRLLLIGVFVLGYVFYVLRRLDDLLDGGLQ